MEQTVVLLIGGTSETAPLAAGLAGAGYAVLVSTATAVPLAMVDHPLVRRRTGRLDAAGLAALARDEGIGAIVAAAHPYAVAAHTAAVAAAEELGIPCLAFRRPAALIPDRDPPLHIPGTPSHRGETAPANPAAGRSPDGPHATAGVSGRGGGRQTLSEKGKNVNASDRSEKPGAPRRPSGGAAPDAPSPPVQIAADHGEAARLACAPGRPVLLTTGSRNLAPYAAEARRTGVPLAVRVLDAPESLAACREAGIPPERVIAARGPFGLAENLAAIGRFGSGVLVTKESGQAGGLTAKLAAAAAAGCLVVLVRRPVLPAAPGLLFDDPAALVAALCALLPLPGKFPLSQDR